MDLTDLKKIGLTEGEMRVYGALLDLGDTTRTQLARKSGISPSKIYDVANRLLEKGIISAVRKDGTLHFSASNPERLNDFVKQKEEDLQRERDIVNEVLPSLMLRYQKTSENADIEVFYGWEGMRTVYNELSNTLSKGDLNIILGASRGQDSTKVSRFFGQYFEKIERRGYKIKIIFNENARPMKRLTSYFEKSKLHEIRYINQETFTEVNVYRNTVLLIMLLRKPVVIRISSKEAADSFRAFFGSVWKVAKH
jgi:sugar-specific transcriptional regulator TrmB